MKKIVKEETIVKKTEMWEAKDGTTFVKKEDCEAYEKSYLFTISQSFDEIPQAKVCSCKLGLYYASEDYETYLIKPRNLQDIVVINAYIEATTDSQGKLTAEYINKDIVLNFGWEHEYCDIIFLDERYKEIERYLNCQHEKIAELEKAKKK